MNSPSQIAPDDKQVSQPPAIHLAPQGDDFNRQGFAQTQGGCERVWQKIREAAGWIPDCVATVNAELKNEIPGVTVECIGITGSYSRSGTRTGPRLGIWPSDALYTTARSWERSKNDDDLALCDRATLGFPSDLDIVIVIRPNSSESTNLEYKILDKFEKHFREFYDRTHILLHAHCERLFAHQGQSSRSIVPLNTFTLMAQRSYPN